jgi:hypothetical protein
MTSEIAHPIFKSVYMKALKDKVKAAHNLSAYNGEKFELDPNGLNSLSGIYTVPGLEKRMMSAESLCDAAIILFEAYRNLSPLIASKETFWAYLCHADLFKFVQQKWPLYDANGEMKKPDYVIDHWFFGIHGYNRNALASLWWAVQCSYDKTKEDPYELTRILFKNYTFRVVSLLALLRVKNAMHGILEFLGQNPEITDEYFENRGQFIAKYFNNLGASKQLSLLGKDFYIKELESLKPVILSIISRKDIHNRDVMSIIDMHMDDEEDDEAKHTD